MKKVFDKEVIDLLYALNYDGDYATKDIKNWVKDYVKHLPG